MLRAIEARETLLRKPPSLPSQEGILRILVGGSVTFEPVKRDGQIVDYRRVDHRNDFIAEAEALKAQRLEQHGAVEIVEYAKPRHFVDVCENTEVSDITIIGHGNIAFVWTADGRNFDWADVARATRAHKLGRFVQRTCGRFERGYSVPLGTFATRSLTSVVAAIGVPIPDVAPPEEVFQPVYTNDQPLAVQIRALNEQFPSLPKANIKTEA